MKKIKTFFVSENGYTVVESVVAMAIVSFVISILSFTLIIINKNNSNFYRNLIELKKSEKLLSKVNFIVNRDGFDIKLAGPGFIDFNCTEGDKCPDSLLLSESENLVFSYLKGDVSYKSWPSNQVDGQPSALLIKDQKSDEILGVTIFYREQPLVCDYDMILRKCI